MQRPFNQRRCFHVRVLCRVNLDTFQSFLQEGVVSSKGTCEKMLLENI